MAFPPKKCNNISSINSFCLNEKSSIYEYANIGHKMSLHWKVASQCIRLYIRPWVAFTLVIQDVHILEWDIRWKQIPQISLNGVLIHLLLSSLLMRLYSKFSHSIFYRNNKCIKWNTSTWKIKKKETC